MQSANYIKRLNNEKGVVLITMLLLMVVTSLIGVIAINTSTVDIQISGNVRRATSAFEGAEAGVDLSIPIIENTVIDGSLNWAGSVPIGVISGLDTTNLATEIMGGNDNNADTPSTAPDVSMSDLGGVAANDVDVDIDRLYSYLIAGGASQFAMGYEGIGAGAGGGGVGVLYRIDSQGQ